MACVVTDIEKLVIETTHFKGNFPESVQVDCCCVPSGALDCTDIESVNKIDWSPLLKRTRMAADCTFTFSRSDLENIGDVTHLKVSMFPDGGLSRVRLYGSAKEQILDIENSSRL